MTKLSPVSKFTINGNSMLPTFHSGQDIISFNWAYLGKKPEVGDVVVIKRDGKEMVKRIQKVLGREVIVTGDNSKESTDSRHFGAVNMDQIVGKVIYVSSHPELDSGSIECSNCDAPIIGIAGRKDAICGNCGFKLTCCGEPA